MNEEKSSAPPGASDNEREQRAYHPDVGRTLAAWDRGESVFSVEMGGLGPGYEQCIQILVFEIIRDNEPLPEKEFGDWGRKAVARCDLGFSGAQVGAARSLAFQVLKYGWETVLSKAPQDRRIQVSRSLPQPPALSDPDHRPSAEGEAVSEKSHAKVVEQSVSGDPHAK